MYTKLCTASRNVVYTKKLLAYICVFMGFFFFFVFEMPLKDFLLYSPILLTLWFRYLQKCMKESCMYLSGQLFFKTPHKTLWFLEKSKETMFCSDLQT